MKEVESVLAAQRKRVVAELKALTKSSTAKELESALSVWAKQSHAETRNKVFGPPVHENAVLAVCKELSITYGASAVKLCFAKPIPEAPRSIPLPQRDGGGPQEEPRPSGELTTVVPGGHSGNPGGIENASSCR
jgi:hypothetical protein